VAVAVFETEHRDQALSGSARLSCRFFALLLALTVALLSPLLSSLFYSFRQVPQDFNNVFNAILTLFELSSTEGWVSVMEACIDATAVDMQVGSRTAMVGHLDIFKHIVPPCTVLRIVLAIHATMLRAIPPSTNRRNNTRGGVDKHVICLAAHQELQPELGHLLRHFYADRLLLLP